MKIFKKHDKYKKGRNVSIFIIGIILIVVAHVNLSSFATFNPHKEFNIIQGKIPNKNNGDVTIAVKLDGESYKEKDENGNKIFPPLKGYRYTQSDCTNEARATVEKNETNNTWDVIVKTSKPAVCTIYFETYTGRNLIEVLKESNNLVTFTHEDTVQTGSNTNTDYRYTGSDPNNYIKFNDELWRIIGIFNTDDGSGNWEERVKIIRNESIEPESSWPNSIIGCNADRDNHSWTNYLKELLNRGDYYNRSGIYKNSGLKDEYKNYISKVKWYDNNDITAFSSVDDLFMKERNGFNLTENIFLVNGSDVFFSTGKDYAVNGYQETNVDSFMLGLNGTLILSNDSFHYITFNRTWYLSGCISKDVLETYSLMPSLYLHNDVNITLDGNGSENNPYVLALY